MISTPSCFKCDKEMFPVFEDVNDSLQPDNGIHFYSQGAYGTTVFDPMDGSTLNIIICDDCVVSSARQGKVILETSRKVRVERTTTTWNPEGV